MAMSFGDVLIYWIMGGSDILPLLLDRLIMSSPASPPTNTWPIWANHRGSLHEFVYPRV